MPDVIGLLSFLFLIKFSHEEVKIEIAFPTLALIAQLVSGIFLSIAPGTISFADLLLFL